MHRRFLHLSAAILFVGGLFARQAVRALISGGSEIGAVVTLTQAAGSVERLMVIPGNLLAIAFGLMLALCGRAPIFGFVQGAQRNWLLAAVLILVLLFLLVPLVFLPRGWLSEAALREASAEGQVTDVAVLPSHRRQGVASALIELAVRETQAAGFRRLWLYTNGNDIVVLTFYRKLGFRLAAVVPAWFGEGSVKAILRLDFGEGAA